MNQQEQKLLFKVIRVAKTLGLKHIRITPGLIAGASDDKMILLLHRDEECVFSFGSAGISQIPNLNNILELFSDTKEIAVKVEVSDGDDDKYAKRATFSTKGINVGYRFSHPAVVEAPKRTGEQAWIQIARISEQYTGYMDRAIKAMSADTIILEIVNNKLILKVKDLHGEAVTIDTDVVITDVDGGEVDNCSFEYRKDVVRIIAHSLETAGLTITRRGFLFCNYEGLTFLLPPFVKDDE